MIGNDYIVWRHYNYYRTVHKSTGKAFDPWVIISLSQFPHSLPSFPLIFVIFSKTHFFVPKRRYKLSIKAILYCTEKIFTNASQTCIYVLIQLQSLQWTNEFCLRRPRGRVNAEAKAACWIPVNPNTAINAPSLLASRPLCLHLLIPTNVRCECSWE